jgi:hypothetical protein
MKLPRKIRRFLDGKGYEVVEVSRGTVIAPLLSNEGERVAIVNGKPHWEAEGGGRWVRVKLQRRWDAVAVENERDAILFVAV